MNDFYQEKTAGSWVISDVSLLAPLRAYCRFAAIWIWLLTCYAAVRCASLLLFFHRPLRQFVCRKIARLWLRGTPPLLGLKIKIKGPKPKTPYFLVSNHISWLDFIVMNLIMDGRCIAMAEMNDLPFVGVMAKAIDTIFVRRVRHDVPRVKKVVLDAIKNQQNIILAPEGTISPGRNVRRFRASLLEPAVQCQKPIHYASITFKTPEGSPPPSEVVLFGPDPHFKPDDDEVNNLALWGPQRTFPDHILRLLSLPYHEAHVTFGEKPILHEDKITLANDLHRAVNKIFSPLE